MLSEISMNKIKEYVLYNKNFRNISYNLIILQSQICLLTIYLHLCNCFSGAMAKPVLVTMAIKSALASHVCSLLKNCIMKFVHLSEPQFVSECVIIDSIETWREKDFHFFIKTDFINKSCISVTEHITYHNHGYWMVSKKRWKC